jgi:hypothetical protein
MEPGGPSQERQALLGVATSWLTRAGAPPLQEPRRARPGWRDPPWTTAGRRPGRELLVWADQAKELLRGDTLEFSEESLGSFQSHLDAGRRPVEASLSWVDPGQVPSPMTGQPSHEQRRRDLTQ